MRIIYALIQCFNSKRFWAPLGAAAILATATVAWAVAPALVFELDGNVADDPGNTIADWNTLNGDCTVPGGGSGSAGGSNTRTCIGSEKPPKIFPTGESQNPPAINPLPWKPADTAPAKN